MLLRLIEEVLLKFGKLKRLVKLVMPVVHVNILLTFMLMVTIWEAIFRGLKHLKSIGNSVRIFLGLPRYQSMKL